MGLAVGLVAGAVSRSKRSSSLVDMMRSAAFPTSAGLLTLRGAVGFAVCIASAALVLMLRGGQGTVCPDRFVALPVGRIAMEHCPKVVGDLVFSRCFLVLHSVLQEPRSNQGSRC